MGYVSLDYDLYGYECFWVHPTFAKLFFPYVVKSKGVICKVFVKHKNQFKRSFNSSISNSNGVCILFVELDKNEKAFAKK